MNKKIVVEDIILMILSVISVLLTWYCLFSTEYGYFMGTRKWANYGGLIVPLFLFVYVLSRDKRNNDVANKSNHKAYKIMMCIFYLICLIVSAYPSAIMFLNDHEFDVQVFWNNNDYFIKQILDFVEKTSGPFLKIR